MNEKTKMIHKIYSGLSALVLAAGCATATPTVKFASQEAGLCTMVELPHLVQIACGSDNKDHLHPGNVRHLQRYSLQRDEAGMPLYAEIEGRFSEGGGVLSKWARCDIPEGVPLCREVLNVYHAQKASPPLPVESVLLGD